MLLAEVVGRVWNERELPALRGRRLLLVRDLDSGRAAVAVDLVEASPGNTVLVAEEGRRQRRRRRAGRRRGGGARGRGRHSSVSRIAFLEEGADATRLGGKGAGLARLVALGLPVPPAFVITVDAYDDDSVRDEVAAAYERIGAGPVAVRSSAAGEDSAERSFAGGHDTFLWVGAPRSCGRACATAGAACTPSAPWPTGASEPRRRDRRWPSCVQQMVDARSAGVS